MLISAMDGLDRDHQRRESVPEDWSLERERKTWVPCLRRLQAALRETVFPLLQRFVLFYIISDHFDWIHLDLPVAEKLTRKQKDKGKKTFSSSSDMRQRIGQKKRLSSDLRKRIGQKKRENFQDSEVINQNIK